jgi:hypothetical protein
MTELPREAIERQHGGRAGFLHSVSMKEQHDGKPVRQGTVHVFDLAGHPMATPMPTPGPRRLKGATGGVS